MKKIKLQKNLQLNKLTISNLSRKDLASLYGHGLDHTEFCTFVWVCTTFVPICDPPH